MLLAACAALFIGSEANPAPVPIPDAPRKNPVFDEVFTESAGVHDLAVVCPYASQVRRLTQPGKIPQKFELITSASSS